MPQVTEWRSAFRDAGLVVFGCAILAGTTNAVRADGIAFIQREDYAILVPCPETLGRVDRIEPDVALARPPKALWIDARGAADYAEWHLANAISMPFDYLAPTDPSAIGRLASSGAREVIAYGDGQDPDCGEQLARELSGKGLRSASYVAGGATALRRAVRDKERRP